MDTKKLDTGSRDAISFLPDEILSDILSLLPIHESVSTSILSKKWRNVFRLVDDIGFDYSLSLHPENGRPERGERLRDFLNRTQSDSPIEKLTLECHVEIEAEMSYVCTWIRDAVEHGVLEVDASIITSTCGMFLPDELFTSRTLVKLKLGTQVSAELPSYVSLPSLKILFIETIFFTLKELSDVLLAGCPVLEELSVRHVEMEAHPYYISSPTIKKLSAHYIGCDFYHYMKVLTFDAPNLVSFDYSGDALCKYTPVNFGSLVEARIDIHYTVYTEEVERPDVSGLIEGISNIETLHLSPTSADVIYRCVKRGLLLPIFNNLLSLSFGSNNKRGWKLLPHLLKKSPKLETLIIQGLNDYAGEVFMPLIKVKVLHILGYRGTVQELKHLKSFLERTKGLELVRLEIAQGVVVDDGKLLQIHKDLSRILGVAASTCKTEVAHNI